MRCHTSRVQNSLFVIGSPELLRDVLADDELTGRDHEIDIVVLPTAAAFTGAAQASVVIAEVCDAFDARVQALMVTDRASANEPYFAQRIAQADLVVLCDGSALHARGVWRATPVATALEAARTIVAIGSVAAVLGDVMIDPRGGAPTTGMGLVHDLAFSPPSAHEQLVRTRQLLGTQCALVVVGAHGALRYANGEWRVLVADDVEVSRGSATTTL